MAQQQDQHLTTEQLSAFLDEQLSAQEQAAGEAHLQSCQQCQGQLDDLRQTVAMLHALPQPALPRSFVLPAEVLHSAAPAIPTAATRTPVSIDEGKRRVEQRTQKRSQKRRTVLQGTLRAMSTIAAVIGFIFLVSAIPIQIGGGSTTSGSAGSTGSTGTGNGSSYGPGDSTPAKTPQIGPHVVGTKPTSPAQGRTHQQTPVGPGSHSRNGTNQQPAVSSSTLASDILQSIGSALDPGTLEGRAIDGSLLIVLALLGFVLSRRRRRAEIT